MSKYDELWRALTYDAQDGLGAAFLKEWLSDVRERLAAHSYPIHEDFAHDDKLEDCLIFLLQDVMVADDFDEFIGVPPAGDCSAPQCDDEEFVGREEISVDRRTLEALVESVLKKYLESQRG